MAHKSQPNRAASDFGTIKPTVGANSKEDWIGNQLKKVYDEALVEDIPSDMLDLLSALDDSDQEDQDSGEETSK